MIKLEAVKTCGKTSHTINKKKVEKWSKIMESVNMELSDNAEKLDLKLDLLWAIPYA